MKLITFDFGRSEEEEFLVEDEMAASLDSDLMSGKEVTFCSFRFGNKVTYVNVRRALYFTVEEAKE